ncbi:MAG: phosphodiester glycosidase family protein, partial [Streptosporangiales bacterium]|nr:phosphodiester glycosidase family protein [Streptosporangiales bacterium]
MRPRILAAVTSVVAAIAVSVTGAASATAATPPQPAAHPSWLPATPDQWPIVVDEKSTEKQTITRGLTHTQDTLNTVGGVQKAQVLQADLTDSNLRLGVVESHDRIVDPANETVSSMAHRTGAVAGVNADFFAIHASGTPLGMVVRDGRLVKSPNPNWNANFGVQQDGSVTIGDETYTGTITDGSAGHKLSSVNTVDDVASGGITRATSDLGPTPIASATVVSGHADGSSLVVDSVNTGVTSLPALPSGVEDLVGGGASAQWLAQNVHPGDTVNVSEKISPDGDLRQAVSGGAVLVKDGKMAVPLQGGGENNQPNPVTGVGVTKDGKHLVVAAFDGHQSETSAEGLTRPALAGWMMEHGAYNAILFDSGGSTEMVGRLAGQSAAGVLNTPSDGVERDVANGLFFYSNEANAGPATTAVANDGAPLTMLTGSQVPLPGYASDAAGNPASDPVDLSVDPPQLADVHDGSISTGSRSGHGTIVARAGSVQSQVPLNVVDQLAGLTLDPTEPDLADGGTQQFSVAGTLKDGTPVTLPPNAVRWTVDKSDLGSITDAGLFTASSDPSAGGLATVTASAGGASATATVAVGQDAVTVDPLTDPSQYGVADAYVNVWPRNVPSPGPQSISVGNESASTEKRLPTDSGSLKLHYDFAATQHVYHLTLYPNDPGKDVIDTRNGQVPSAIGVWVKTDPPLSGGLYFSAGIYQGNNQPTSLYPDTATTDGWQHIVIPLPAGLQYPLRFNYLNLVVINPATHLVGDMYVSDLEALYSPRPPKPYTYTPVPENPSWLSYSEDPAKFRTSGTTLAAFDDAHVVASDQNATGSVVMRKMSQDFQALPTVAKPAAAQALGDMPDSGT